MNEANAFYVVENNQKRAKKDFTPAKSRIGYGNDRKVPSGRDKWI